MGSASTEVHVGVLAIQGAFAEHIFSLQSAFELLLATDHDIVRGKTLRVSEVRSPNDLEGLDGLVIPGGESTTMAKFLLRNNFIGALRHYIRPNDGQPAPAVWGTCAGLILLSDHVLEEKEGGQCNIGGLPITSTRNTYGRQKESFEINIDVNPILGGEPIYNGVFIRAPGIQSIDSDDVTVLASIPLEHGAKPVAAEKARLMATTFHPELTSDTRWHRFFLLKVITPV
ncbi:hypothetical protein CAPTEDRAFT_18938 [Capitella teleta]|uniref:glutaminase n=1 Tax=Capitella teleta TaxID=283909 RepID=X1ZML9_CAPTE|nr:hypothetical protein CAPTEDRAFT_18938 [Capitella teleta]|eukprot:ELU04698.1 hypothetical protein CAPTEDRAFT_18938 [Capitella teleta]